MDSKEIRNLMEAYSEIYAPEQIDEALTGERYKQVMNKPGGTAYSRKVSADPSKRATRGGKGGESDFGAGDRGSGNRAAKRAAALKNEELDIFDVVLEFLQAEGYAETLEEAEWLMANVIDEEAIEIITELTGGKGHPGYKAGSKDHGPMQSGHPADTFKRTMKGGTMSQRHGDHLGDLDDDDDDDDGLEAALKDTARKKRENVRKPLRNKVKAARKVLSKEEYVSEEQLQELSNRKLRAYVKKSEKSHQDLNKKWDQGTATYKDKYKSINREYGQERALKKLNKESFEHWVNELVEEGYNLSDYTWDEMYEFYLNEAIYSEKGKAKAAEMIAKRSTPSGRAKSGKGANVAQIRQIRGSGRGDFDREGLGGTPMTPTMAKNPIKKQNYTGTGNKAARRAGLTPTREKPNAWKEDFEAWLDEAMTNYEKNRKRAAQRAAARNAARDQGKTGAVPGVGYVTPRRERETWTDESGKTRHAKGL